MKFSYLAARVFDTPLIIARPKLHAILSVLGPRMGFGLHDGELKPQLYADSEDDGIEFAAAPLYLISDGVAVIPVIGTLVHRASGMSALSGMTSYLDLSCAFNAALVDDQVKAIVLEIDSPGGEANGCFDFADEIFAARGVKPIVAVANDWADSGAYLIASACERIVVTQTGEVGSIGVVWCHVDYSQQNKMLGEAVTYIYAGERKIDGNPDQPLSDKAKTSISADINKTYALFCAAVARNRGMSVEAVQATQAQVFVADDALAVGFADEISTFKDVMNSLSEQAHSTVLVSGANPGATLAPSQEHVMTTKPIAPAGSEPAAVVQPQQQPPETVSKAALDAAVATTGKTAVEADRKRTAAITGCEQAKGREDLARHLANETDMSAEAAQAILAKAPLQAAVASPKNRLEQAMTTVNNPKVGADIGGDASEEEQIAAHAAQTVQLYRGKPAASVTH